MHQSSSELTLTDLSSLPRAGMKGKDLSHWVKSQDYEVGAESNCSYLQDDGVLVARLSPGELLLLSNPADPKTDATTNSPEATYTCYPVHRQDSHYWFAIKGARAPEMFAKLCAVNLSPEIFANRSVAQTSVARTSAVIVRHDIEDELCYYLLGDSSTVLYMRNCLIDAMSEFNGQCLD